jgi:ketosteroid isomerase-like protein
MAEHPDAALVRKTWEAMSRGEGEAMSDVGHPDVTLRVQGSHRFAGEHKGHDAVGRWYRGLVEASRGTIRWEPQHLFVDGHGHVIGVRRVTAERNGKRLDALGAVLYTIVNGRITRTEQFEEDLDAVNDFWA